MNTPIKDTIKDDSSARELYEYGMRCRGIYTNTKNPENVEIANLLYQGFLALKSAAEKGNFNAIHEITEIYEKQYYPISYDDQNDKIKAFVDLIDIYAAALKTTNVSGWGYIISMLSSIERECPSLHSLENLRKQVIQCYDQVISVERGNRALDFSRICDKYRLYLNWNNKKILKEIEKIQQLYLDVDFTKEVENINVENAIEKKNYRKCFVCYLIMIGMVILSFLSIKLPGEHFYGICIAMMIMGAVISYKDANVSYTYKSKLPGIMDTLDGFIISVFFCLEAISLIKCILWVLGGGASH